MENTYWKGNGKFQRAANDLNVLLPITGASKSPSLELFRKAMGCYRDVHMGNMNYAGAFRNIFKIKSDPFRRQQATPDMYMHIDMVMDTIIETAANDHNITLA